MMRLLVILGVLGLVGCVETQRAADDIARRSAKATVAKTLSTRFPAVPQAAVTPFTDCVIDNADAREIGALAADAVTGIDAATTAQVSTILQRPATQTCIARAGLTALAT